MNVHIIGGGNLGCAIALGIQQYTTGNTITLTRRNTKPISNLAKYGINISSDNTNNIASADIIILTVKPWQIDAVLEEILPYLSDKIIA